MAIFSFQVLLPFIQYVYIYFTKAILLVKYSSHFHFTFYPSLSLTATFLLIILSHKGSPRILEWVAYPFSSRSSRPRNQTRVSFIAGRFLTN